MIYKKKIIGTLVAIAIFVVVILAFNSEQLIQNNIKENASGAIFDKDADLNALTTDKINTENIANKTLEPKSNNKTLEPKSNAVASDGSDLKNNTDILNDLQKATLKQGQTIFGEQALNNSHTDDLMNGAQSQAELKGLLPGCPCYGNTCLCLDTLFAKAALDVFHVAGETAALLQLRDIFNNYRDYFSRGNARGTFNFGNKSFFTDRFLVSMTKMSRQLSATAMHQAMMIGMMMDAKTQLETQRVYQRLKFQAHKDYVPSGDMCWIGTNVRSLMSSEHKSQLNRFALNDRQMARHLGRVNSSGALGATKDKENRWNIFKDEYCDPKDNNWGMMPGGIMNEGLEAICGAGGGSSENINIDINFGSLVENKRTLEIDFTDQASTDDELAVLMLGNNLYGHETLQSVSDSYLIKNADDGSYQDLYMALRRVAAKRNVAESSYNAIVSLKSSGAMDASANVNSAKFLAAIYKEMGVPDDDIFEIIGENPSYYAQLEVLAKKLYQNTDFYANLYDTPANTERKSVALKAIELMLDRAIYESETRQEMLTSVLLAAELDDDVKKVGARLSAQ